MDLSGGSNQQQAPSSGQSLGTWQTSTNGAGPPPVGGYFPGASSNNISPPAFSSFFDSIFLPISQGGGAAGTPNPVTSVGVNLTTAPSVGSPYAVSSVDNANGKVTMKITKKKADATPKAGQQSNQLINSVIDRVAKGLATSVNGAQTTYVPVAAASGTASSTNNNFIQNPSVSVYNYTAASATLPLLSTPSMGKPTRPPPTPKKRKTATPRRRPATTNNPVTTPKTPKQSPKSKRTNTKAYMGNIGMLPNAANAPSSLQPPPPVLAVPTMPPDWQTYYDQTSISLSTYQTFPVDPHSLEYTTIKELLNPITVISAEKIVNPDLWNRYSSARKEMLKAKTDDLALLSKLGLDEMELMRRAHNSCNFDKDPLLNTEIAKYSPNEVLLFHCTRSKQNLDKILSQGLDERLSSITGGLLGKGIYFADNPQKSIQYDGGTATILIFAVLLGDCLCVDDLTTKHALVREPEKEKQQQRGFNDQFFDSITARPGGHNEYVIYNRYQCFPLYQVKYQYNTAHVRANEFDTARQQTPTIAWRKTPEAKSSMPNQALDGAWPFFAASLFERMGVLPELDSSADQFEAYTLDDGVNAIDVDVDDTAEKLMALANLGFADEEKNKDALLKYDNNLEHAVNFLLDNENRSAQQTHPQTSTSSSGAASTATSSIAMVDLSSDMSEDDSEDASNIKKAKIVTEDLPEELANWALDFDAAYLQASTSTPATMPTIPPPVQTKEECSICCEEYDAFSLSPTLWKELQCSHRLCRTCYQSIHKSGTTMAGVLHASVRCPFCQGITGEEVGTCPDGKMTVKIIPSSCEGYPGCKSLEINYFISAGQHHLNRTAYLPDNKEGNDVLKLLRLAWDRRLCFTIGSSITTGTQNVLVWNIHHKTALSGGVQSHGYPDPGYLDRVRWELKAYGIE